MLQTSQIKKGEALDFVAFSKIVLQDYFIASASRHCSIIGRKEVLSGKASFGIFGDGKELCQIAMAKIFNKGDWRSGYYRDMTLMFASGITNIQEFFSQLYGNTDLDLEPASGGRQMNSHFGTRYINTDGEWLPQTETKNSFSDISSTAGQMSRSVGLGLASKLYREMENLQHAEKFSNNGKEIVFVNIGNGSTSEGVFWETVNACGVLQIPVIISIYDDGYGISVDNQKQTTKECIFDVLKGFQKDNDAPGFELMKVKGWDYSSLVSSYAEAEKITRNHAVPVLIHVDELTQPLGHSTSGSHERYKSKERLEWEKEFDCLSQMELWMTETGIASNEQLQEINQQAYDYVREEQKQAWENFRDSMNKEIYAFKSSVEASAAQLPKEVVEDIKNKTSVVEKEPNFKINDIHKIVRKALLDSRRVDNLRETAIFKWYDNSVREIGQKYHSKLYCEDKYSHTNVEIKPAIYDENPKMVDGRVVLNHCFDKNFENLPNLIALGEDIGKLGGVNKCLEGLQEKYGALRIRDTGIREATIVGEGIGLSTRGFKTMVEIQYLDYIYYPLFVLADDLTNLYYRTKGGSKSPLIIRTRGHRLEGIWHSGSPMGMLINSLKGMLICTPRNFTQAAGMYNTLLASDDPALVIESLMAYRLKEKLPNNIGDFTVPLGITETLKEGEDITLVSYGSCIHIILHALPRLQELDISVELIDVQTLIPFDRQHAIMNSIKKTNKVLFIDEDVPGGASAYMLQKTLEEQDAFKYLDMPPKTLTAKEHRPPYGEDGNYFTKPSSDDVVEAVYEMMHEYSPTRFPHSFL